MFYHHQSLPIILYHYATFHDIINGQLLFPANFSQITRTKLIGIKCLSSHTLESLSRTNL